MGAAGEAAQARGRALPAIQAFHLATRGAAAALRLEDRIGSIAVGHEADLVVLDRRATPLLDFRLRRARDLEETLAALATLGDDRAVRATWVAGRCAWRRG
jgi:guanine deaminase